MVEFEDDSAEDGRFRPVVAKYADFLYLSSYYDSNQESDVELCVRVKAEYCIRDHVLV